MSDMLITMCVIAYNEEQNINGILECIKNQDYDHNNMEVVLEHQLIIQEHLCVNLHLIIKMNSEGL